MERQQPVADLQCGATLPPTDIIQVIQAFQGVLQARFQMFNVLLSHKIHFNTCFMTALVK